MRKVEVDRLKIQFVAEDLHNILIRKTVLTCTWNIQISIGSFTFTFDLQLPGSRRDAAMFCIRMQSYDRGEKNVQLV